MFGASMTSAEGPVKELEDAILRRFIDPESLERARHLGEGTRRSLRLALHEVAATPSGGRITLSFVLPKGGYATTVLANLCRPREPELSKMPAKADEESEE
jgi:tRNA pseudouridine13 synthase